MKKLAEWQLALPLALAFASIFLAPLLMLIGVSFFNDDKISQPGFGQWAKFLGDPFSYKVIADTMLLGLKTVCATIVIGYPLALIYLDNITRWVRGGGALECGMSDPSSADRPKAKSVRPLASLLPFQFCAAGVGQWFGSAFAMPPAVSSASGSYASAIPATSVRCSAPASMVSSPTVTLSLAGSEKLRRMTARIRASNSCVENGLVM